MKKKFLAVAAIIAILSIIFIIQYQYKIHSFIYIKQHNPIFKIKPSNNQENEKSIDLTTQEIYNYLSSLGHSE